MSKTNYKRLGDYIREVDVRNRDLKVTRLMGINIGKYFMPSVANVIGTDLSNYKVVAKNQFACNLMHVGRDEKIPMAMLENNEFVIVSPAYFVFQISQLESLLPEYLMMWFRNSHFDKEAWFYTDCDVRGGMTKSALLDMKLPIPPIDQQRKLVAEYNAIQQRIKLNEQLIVKLEETAQAIYRKMFVDGIDKNNLPDGWRINRFTNILKLSGGGTPDTSNLTYWNGNIPFFSPADISNGYYTFTTEKHISKEGLNNCSSRLYPQDSIFITARGTVGKVTIIGVPMAMNQSCYGIDVTNCNYVYYIHQFVLDIIEKMRKEAIGAVFSALVTKDFEIQITVDPPEKEKIKYNTIIRKTKCSGISEQNVPFLKRNVPLNSFFY